ncbi:MAG: macro domain-containing protein [Thermodesulfobacteriota bacterium]
MAHSSCLRPAEDNGIHRIAFPAVNRGACGYPVRRAARVVFGELET